MHGQGPRILQFTPKGAAHSAKEIHQAIEEAGHAAPHLTSIYEHLGELARLGAVEVEEGRPRRYRRLVDSELDLASSPPASLEAAA